MDSFSYGEVERILASLFHAGEAAQKTTLRARIKHFQKLGLGLRSQRGKKVIYDHSHIFQFALAGELANFGIDPSILVELVQTKWEAMFVPSFQGKDWRTRKPLAEPLFLYVIPELMNAAWHERSGTLYKGVLDFDIVPGSGLPEWKDLTGDARRFLVLNLGEMVRMIDEQIAAIKPEAGHVKQIDDESAKKFEADRRRGEEEARKLLAKVKSLREKK